MDLNQLQAFEQIILQGNFSKAARKLDISQPSISLRIKALEQELGGALFARGGSRLQLTELGKSFSPYARQALHAMTSALEVAQHTILGKKGQIMIGTLPSLTTGFFASALARLHHMQPHLNITAHTGHNQQILEMLHDGFVQLGFLTGPFFSPEMTTILRIKEPLVAIAHVKHPLAQQKQVTVQALETMGNPLFRVDWSLEVRYWQSHKLSEQGTVIEVPPHTAYDLICRGIGVALLTRSFVQHGLHTGQLVELEIQGMPSLHRESVLIRHNRDKELPEMANELIRILQEEARSIEH